MLIGGVVGSLAAGVTGECMEYKLPLCRKCRTSLSKAVISDMKGIDDKKVKTPFLKREIEPGAVLVTFKNAQYAQVFKEANRRYVFDSVDELNAADEKVIIVPMGNPDLPVHERIKTHLAQYLPLQGLFIEPDFPKGKLVNARKNLKLSLSVPVFAVIDLTLFGSMENAVLFSRDRLYYHNPGNKARKSGSVLYEEFQGFSIYFGDDLALHLGSDHALDMTNSLVKKDKAFDIFESIRLGLLPLGHLDRVEAGEVPSKGEPRTPSPEAILDLLKKRVQTCLFAHPNIPDKRLKNIKDSLKLKSSVPILGIIDTTLLGSGKHGVVFTSEGIQFHNDWTAKTKEGRISYLDLTTRRIMPDGDVTLKLDRDEVLSVLGEMNASSVADLFQDIVQLCYEED
jgi:hypothetical protein